METPFGEKYMTSPASVAKHIAHIEESLVIANCLCGGERLGELVSLMPTKRGGSATDKKLNLMVGTRDQFAEGKGNSR